jgi:hypothetical protein
MPIQVTCAKCETTFKVSEKFAGKEGPCPKCKTKIKIPAAPPPIDVVIHEPEPAGLAAMKTGGATDATKSTRPLTRKEAAINPVAVTLSVVGVAVVLLLTYMLRAALQENLWLRCVGLVLVSVPIAQGGYSFLREDEIEPHRGLALWIRSAICGAAYSALWGALHFVLPVFGGDAYAFVALVPAGIALAVGAGIAFASLDMDFGNGFIHCCFFTLVSLGLAYLAGLQMPWIHTVAA